MKHNLILKSGISFRLLVSLNVLLHTSQQYGRSPVCTHWCTFTLHMSLNVTQNDTHHILYQKTRVLYQIPLESRTTYIYIYVATSVTNFGAISFTPYMHTAVFCVAVDSWRSGLRFVVTVVLPLPPHPPWRALLLYVNTNQLRILCNRLGLFRQGTSCLCLERSWDRLEYQYRPM